MVSLSVCEYVKLSTAQLFSCEMKRETKPNQLQVYGVHINVIVVAQIYLWCRLFRLFPFYAFQTVGWCAIETSIYCSISGGCVITRIDPSSIAFCDISFITKLENEQKTSPFHLCERVLHAHELKVVSMDTRWSLDTIPYTIVFLHSRLMHALLHKCVPVVISNELLRPISSSPFYSCLYKSP